MIALALAAISGSCILLLAPSGRARRLERLSLLTAAGHTTSGHQGSGLSPSVGGRFAGSHRAGLWLVGAGIAAWLLHPLVAVVGVVALTGGSRWRARVDRASQTTKKLAALPGTLDLLAVVLGAGGTISSGIRMVAKRGDNTVSPIFQQLMTSREAGQSLVTVLHCLPDQLGEPYRPLARALIATERDGAPIASLLVRLAEEAGANRRRASEAKAKQLSVQLLFPLVVCFLPAVLLGAVLPLVIVAAGRFLA